MLPNNMAWSPIIALIVPYFLMLSVESSCPISNCTAGEPPIQFPFRLKYIQNEKCGSKGFDLWCNVHNRTVLSLPSSGDFLVSHINYQEKFVVLQDPDDCLASRLRGFSLNGSIFSSKYYRNFTFLEFPSDMSHFLGDVFEQVQCLTTRNYSIFVVPDDVSPVLLPGTGLMSVCRNNWTVSLPILWQTPSITEAIWLRWDETASPPHQRISTGSIVWIVLGVIFPWPLMVLWIWYYLKRTSRSNTDAFSPGQPPTGQQHLWSGGMDMLAIELYPKKEVGDSVQLPRPSDNTCSICLSEYQSKETIRTIPDCGHYFHAHCIDPWLNKNGSCPLCRNWPRSTGESTTEPNIGSSA